ncbi:MAG: hypothetical protein V7752_00495 [Halopseudomonas sp.]
MGENLEIVDLTLVLLHLNGQHICGRQRARKPLLDIGDLDIDDLRDQFLLLLTHLLLVVATPE